MSWKGGFSRGYTIQCCDMTSILFSRISENGKTSVYHNVVIIKKKVELTRISKLADLGLVYFSIIKLSLILCLSKKKAHDWALSTGWKGRCRLDIGTRKNTQRTQRTCSLRHHQTGESAILSRIFLKILISIFIPFEFEFIVSETLFLSKSKWYI